MNKIIKITDLTIPELDIYARLSEIQLATINAPSTGIFIAESPKVITRALNAGNKPLSILIETKQLESDDAEIKEIIDRCDNIDIFTAEFEVLTNLTGFKLTRGMLCAMQRTELQSVAELCASAKRITVLENVMNPTNVGAIFRSAAALNMDAVILTHGSSDPLYRRAIRVSMGTVFQIPWTFIESDNYLEELRTLGFKTVAMALREDSVLIDDPNILAEDKLAVIMGTEGEGLNNETIENADYTVCIPMSNGVDSLNVAAASAVAFYVLGNKNQ